jgi:hypothetical protein
MALETMKGVTEINGEKIFQSRIYFPLEQGKPAEINWPATDEARKEYPIFVDHEVNMISFRIQNGPIKEVGKNGCQVEDVIAVAKHIVEQLNAKYPCRENAMMITKLDEAIMWSKKRTADRQARQVEGLSKA